MVNFGFSSCTVKIILYFSYEHYNFSKCLAPLTYYFTCLDLKSFCSLFKFFVITIKIRESTHISKLWAETAERCIFLFFNYQVHSQDKKRACTRVTQAGWVQLYLKNRCLPLNQQWLRVIRTDLYADCWGLLQSSWPLTTRKMSPLLTPSL